MATKQMARTEKTGQARERVLRARNAALAAMGPMSQADYRRARTDIRKAKEALKADLDAGTLSRRAYDSAMRSIRENEQGIAKQGQEDSEQSEVEMTKAERDRARDAALHPEWLRPTSLGPRVVYGDEHDYLRATDPIYRAHAEKLVRDWEATEEGQEQRALEARALAKSVSRAQRKGKRGKRPASQRLGHERSKPHITGLQAVGSVAVGTVGYVGGRKLNAAYGEVTPLKLYPSTVGVALSGALALAAHQAGWRGARTAAIAAVVGMGTATLAEHVAPKSGVLKKEA